MPDDALHPNHESSLRSGEAELHQFQHVQVRDAARAMLVSVQRTLPEARIEGLRVEAMARADLAAGRLRALSPQPLDVALYWKTLRVMKAPLAPLTAAIRKAAAEGLI